MKKKYGYEEIAHTADWAISVMAPDLENFLITAAKGMYSLSEIQLREGGISKVEFSLDSFDTESMVVDFLSELIFISDLSNEAVIAYDLEIHDYSLHAILQLQKIKYRKKEIKAVTFHNLKIETTENGLLGVIVFDV